MAYLKQGAAERLALQSLPRPVHGLLIEHREILGKLNVVPLANAKNLRLNRLQTLDRTRAVVHLFPLGRLIGGTGSNLLLNVVFRGFDVSFQSVVHRNSAKIT